MTDPTPGTSAGSDQGPTNPPVEFVDDGMFRHMGYWNSFQFAPPLTHEDALLVSARAKDLGYDMLFRRADYSLEEVQAQLVGRGPSAFLDVTILQEDISPKEPPATAEQRMAERLGSLGPQSELIVTDPYFFTNGRQKDSEVYAASVGRMLEPALTRGLSLTFVVEPAQHNADVRAAVQAELHRRCEGLTVSVVESSDFHDRFWIADRSRGLVVGASLNKIGRKLFFVDELNDEDVAAVLIELDAIYGTRA